MAKRKFFTLPRMVSVSVMTAFAVFGRIGDCHSVGNGVRTCKRVFDGCACGTFVEFLFRSGALDACANACVGTCGLAFGFVNKL